MRTRRAETVWCYRSSDLFKCCWLPWRCCLGHARCESVSTLPSSYRLCDCRQIFQDHEPVELASTCIAENNRRWPTSNESLEPKGTIALTVYMLLTGLTDCRYTTVTDSISCLSLRPHILPCVRRIISQCLLRLSSFAN